MDYHSDFSAITRTMLKDFRTEGRRWYHGRYITRTIQRKKPTPDMEFGVLAHYAIIEPHKFDDHYAVYPASALKRNGARGTDACNEFEAECAAAGKIAIKESERDQLIDVARAVMDSDTYKKLVARPELRIEQEVRWTDPLTGLPLKCKPDWLLPLDRLTLIVDLKTCADASPSEFKRSALSQQYWLQAAHYTAGVREEIGGEVLFRFLAIEKDKPHRVSEHEIEIGDDEWDEYRRTLEQLAYCYANDDWREPWEGVTHKIRLYERSLDSDAVQKESLSTQGVVL